MNKRLKFRFDTFLVVTTAAAWLGLMVALVLTTL
jgi:hypothetical protein